MRSIKPGNITWIDERSLAVWSTQPHVGETERQASMRLCGLFECSVE